MYSEKKQSTIQNTDSANKIPLNAFNRWGYVNKQPILFELTDSEKTAFNEGLKNVHDSRGKVAKYATYTADDLLVFRASASSTSLFWCFNHWSEALQLARYLPKSINLIAAISTHQLTELHRWRRKTRFHEHLVSRYFDTLKAEGVISSELLLGGNCQGAPVAESLAIRVKNKTGCQPKLITIDYTLRKSYNGPKLMLFGSESNFNPFNDNSDPLNAWAKLPGEWQYRFLNAAHGQYFREPAIVEVSKILAAQP